MGEILILSGREFQSFVTLFAKKKFRSSSLDDMIFRVSSLEDILVALCAVTLVRENHVLSLTFT